MKFTTLPLLCLVSVSLSARAENSSSSSAPATSPTKAAQYVVVTIAAPKPAKSAELAAPVEAKIEAPAPVASKSAVQGTMEAVEVNGLSDFKPTAPGLTDLRTEQKAAMALRLTVDAPKATFGLPIERPVLAAPKLSLTVDGKNLAVAFPTK